MEGNNNISTETSRPQDISLVPILQPIILEGYEELHSYYPVDGTLPPLSDCLESIISGKLFVDHCNVDFSYLEMPNKVKKGARRVPPRILLALSIMIYGRQKTVRCTFADLRTTPIERYGIGQAPEQAPPVQGTLYNFRKSTRNYVNGERAELEATQKPESQSTVAVNVPAGGTDSPDPAIAELDAVAKVEAQARTDVATRRCNPFYLAFAHFVTYLVELFGLDGETLRTDSTLVDSNIAHFPRYVIIIQVLRLLDKGHALESIRENTCIWRRLNAILQSNPKRECYVSDKEAIHAKMSEAGRIMNIIIKKSGDNAHPLLRRIFDDQFRVSNNGHIVVKDGESIRPDSIQSAYDTEAVYRKKGDITVRGYVVNIAEIFGEAIALVVDIALGKANVSDSSFTIPAVDCANGIIKGAHGTEDEKTTAIRKLRADGAYQNPEIRKILTRRGIEYGFTGFQDCAGNFQFAFDEDGRPTTVLRRDTGEVFVPTLSRRGGSYVIPNTGANMDKVKYIYFTPAQIEKKLVGASFGCLPPEEKMQRNNVEATMAHYLVHLDGRQCRFRGQYACERFTICRGIWMNTRRICEYYTKACAAIGTSVNGSLKNLARGVG